MSSLTFTQTDFGKFTEMMKSMKPKQRKNISEKIQRMIETESVSSDEILKIMSKKANPTQKKARKTCWHVFLDEMREKAEPGINQNILLQDAKPLWAEMSDEDKIPYREKAKELNAQKQELSDESEDLEDKSDIENEISNDSELSENSDEEDAKPKKKKASKPKKSKKK